SPVLPKNNKFFSSGSSKLSIKFVAISLILIIFCLGEILALYFFTSTVSEYKSKLKLSKFSLSRLPILDLLKSISNIFCLIQLHKIVLLLSKVIYPVSLQIGHSYIGSFASMGIFIFFSK